MADFKELQVWQRGRALVPALYAVTDDFPAAERSGLTSQIRRAAVSIPSNIAEGSARHTLRDQARCYRIALASAREVECLVRLAGDLKMIDTGRQAAILSELDEVQRMLSGLTRSCVRRMVPTR